MDGSVQNVVPGIQIVPPDASAANQNTNSKRSIEVHHTPRLPAGDAPWQYNILTQGAGGRALTYSETLRKAVIIMSTYEELSLIVSVALLIVAILNFTHKK